MDLLHSSIPQKNDYELYLKKAETFCLFFDNSARGEFQLWN